LSRSSEAFADRAEAGRLLGGVLSSLRGQRAVVLGVMRGGVAVAASLARAIEGELDVAVAHKLGAPGNPELAIGAVAEDGSSWVDESLREATGADRRYLETERLRQLEVLRSRAGRLRALRPKVALAGRPVVVTDDGVATGATLRAALVAARREGPSRLVAALPVGPAESLERLADLADEVVCLRSPAWFAAVGQFYVSFEQVSDADLELLLREANGAGRGERSSTG